MGSAWSAAAEANCLTLCLDYLMRAHWGLYLDPILVRRGYTNAPPALARGRDVMTRSDDRWSYVPPQSRSICTLPHARGPPGAAPSSIGAVGACVRRVGAQRP